MPEPNHFPGRGTSETGINQHLKHYNEERNHQGIEIPLIKPEIMSREGDITSQKRLGGMLTYYFTRPLELNDL